MFKYLNRKLENTINNKLTWISNRLFIEGYGQILTMSSTEIIISEYLINGQNLKVSSFDGYLLEIIGNIEKITRRDNNEHLQSKDE